MLIELLSMDNYVSYNIKIAEIFGLHASIYLSELMNINDKAIRKSKITGESYFTVDRNYIEKRTTLTKSEQLKIDESFKQIGLLKIDNQDQNTITLDITVLTSIMAGGKQVVEELKLLTNKISKTKKTKDEAIKDNLKNLIITDNPELHQAYCDWIDAVYAKQGWMSARSVKVAQKDIDDVSGRNLDIALRIIDIAAIRGYREMEWAINCYKRDYEPTFRLNVTTDSVQQTNVGLSDEVF